MFGISISSNTTNFHYCYYQFIHVYVISTTQKWKSEDVLRI